MENELLNSQIEAFSAKLTPDSNPIIAAEIVVRAKALLEAAINNQPIDAEALQLIELATLIAKTKAVINHEEAAPVPEPEKVPLGVSSPKPFAVIPASQNFVQGKMQFEELTPLQTFDTLTEATEWAASQEGELDVAKVNWEDKTAKLSYSYR